MWYKEENIIICILAVILVLLLFIKDGRDNSIGFKNFSTKENKTKTEGNEALQEGIPIISETILSEEDAKEWVKTKGASDEFIKLADLYWKYSAERGNINPALAYIQAAKETAFGNFGGVLDASYHNPCGLKTTEGGGDYEKSAHTKFKSWDDGVKAHLDHLALYAGAENYPRKDTLDPRHFASIYGQAKIATDLSTRWAPSPTYGEEIVKLYNQMLESVGKVEVFATK